MDPLSAVGLAGNVVQLLDFGLKLIEKSKDIYASAEGIEIRNIELEHITQNLVSLNRRLRNRSSRVCAFAINEDERALESLTHQCNAVGEALIAALEKAKVTGKHKTWKSVRQALKSVLGHDGIQDLHNRLKEYREQIVVVLLVIASSRQSELNNNVQGVGASVIAAETRIVDETRQARTQILEAIRNPQHSPNKSESIGLVSQLLSRMVLDKLELSNKQAVLDSLYFSRMQDRREYIAEAHNKTFQWVLQAEVATERPWANLAKWLKTSNGIYWIGGKPGSGKSTLMKYIEQDKRTITYLEEWSNPLPLVTASFYFWNPGTLMQKSQLGLLRSLLYEILRQQPNLIPNALPMRWQSTTAHGNSTFEWTLTELTKAFQALGASDLGAKFCFIIDGLDEFDGDHQHLVQFLFRMTLTSNIKVLASSRPWLVFQDSFQDSPQLALQDLTHDDIRAFAQDSLHNHPRFSRLLEMGPEAPKLVTQISDRASGVFLWVFLVVRSLMEGITNADRISDLQKRLEQLPNDLEQYFLHMLTNLDPFYLHQASQFFRLALEARKPLSVLTYSFLDEEDPDFALKRAIAPMSESEEALRCETVERRLNSRCKGLIECRRWQTRDTYSDGDGVVDGLVAYEVHFLHRTVRDFLSTPTTQVKLVAIDTPEFNANMTLARAYVAQIKALRYASHSEANFQTLWHLVLETLHYMSQVKEAVPAEAQRDLLQEMDRAAAIFRREGIVKRQCAKDSHWVNTGYRFGFEIAWNNDLITLAIQCNLVAPVQQLLLRQTSLDRVGKPLLAFALIRPPETLDTVYIRNSKSYNSPQVEMVKLLLQHGADPNTMDEGKTIWARYLESMYELILRSDANFKTGTGKWFEITKLMIQHGALPITCDIPVPTGEKAKRLKLSDDTEMHKSTHLSAQNVIRLVFGGSGYNAEELEELLEPQVIKSENRPSRRHVSDSYLQAAPSSGLKYSASLHANPGSANTDRPVSHSTSFSHQRNVHSMSSHREANDSVEYNPNLLFPVPKARREPSFGKMMGRLFGRSKPTD